MGVPLTRPNPPRLSQAGPSLRTIESRGLFSNFGPVNTEFEAAMLARMFGGEGACLTVCNATIGLMLAIQNAIGPRLAHAPAERRYALMPSFTFAAAAHAAMWCGLTPLFCDIDPTDWAASATAEEEMLRRYGKQVAVVVPYATFGHDIDLARYERVTRRLGVPVVVDAAASLGTVQADGRGFGAGFGGTVVFSMHATKSFATGEGGLLYSADAALMRNLRAMSNFGFGKPRTATMPGLNAKMSEVGALLGQLRLNGYDKVMDHRASLVRQYRQALPELDFQPQKPARQAHQFASALLPPDLAPSRAAIQAAMLADGIGSAVYFSPHVAEQDYFREHAVFEDLPVTTAVAARIVSLPLFDVMTRRDLATVVASLRRQIALARTARPILQLGVQVRQVSPARRPRGVRVSAPPVPASPVPAALMPAPAVMEQASGLFAPQPSK